MKPIHLVFSLGLSIISSLSISQTISTNIPILTLQPGWNLVGNCSNKAIEVSSVFGGNESSINSVWRWNTSSQGWDFYTPSAATNLAQYASSKGYGVLNSVAVGEGFWVNVNSAAPIQLSLPYDTSLAPVTPSSVSNFAGTYYGQYSWSPNGSGPWTIAINTTGSVTGQGTVTCTGSCTNAANYPLSGSVSGSGSVSFSTSGGDTCSGTMNASSGTISGTCNYAFNNSSGSFSGVRQMQQYTIQINATGSTAHVTNVNVCATVYSTDTCGPNGGYAVGQTGQLSVSGSAAGAYSVKIPTGQPAASYCSVTAGGSGVFGADIPYVTVTCQ